MRTNADILISSNDNFTVIIKLRNIGYLMLEDSVMKWIHLFDGVTAVIFCASLSEWVHLILHLILLWGLVLNSSHFIIPSRKMYLSIENMYLILLQDRELNSWPIINLSKKMCFSTENSYLFLNLFAQIWSDTCRGKHKESDDGNKGTIWLDITTKMVWGMNKVFF